MTTRHKTSVCSILWPVLLQLRAMSWQGESQIVLDGAPPLLWG